MGSSCFLFCMENGLEILGGYKCILFVQFPAFLSEIFSASMVVRFSVFTNHLAEYLTAFDVDIVGWVMFCLL